MAARDADGDDRLPRVRKTRAVLAILAMAAPEPVTRTQLTALLWSRRQLPQARGSLRQALRELLVTLGPASGFLLVDRTQAALAIKGLQVDAWEVAAAGPAQPDRLMLWQGLLLPDLIGLDPAFDQWIGIQRQDLARRARTAAESILAGSSSAPTVIAAAERLLGLDPTHEKAWLALIRAQAGCGERAAALGSYERYCVTLSAQCQTGPSAETAALAASLRSAAAMASTLPTAPTAPTASSAPAASTATPRRRGARQRLRLGIAALRGGEHATDGAMAAGLTEEMIVAFSRFRWLGCVPCRADQTDHDVDLLLSGRVQRNGDRLRVLLRLMDLHRGGEVVWAERFERTLTDLFAFQDEVTSATAARIEPRLWLWEDLRTGAYDRPPCVPRDLVRLAVPALHRLDRPRFMAAGDCLARAVELDPDDATALAWAAQWHLFCVGQGWATDPGAGMQRAQDLAERAVRIDPEDARGLTLAGHVRGFLNRRPEEALRLHERAIAANPNLPLTWCLFGLAQTYVGDCAEGIRNIRHAQALSPEDPLDYFHEMALCLSYLLRGEYESASTAGRRAIAINPDFSSAHKVYLAAAGHLGREDESGASRAKLLELESGFSVRQAVARCPMVLPAARSLYAEGLRSAGLA
jgi:DNA-binding SARP family transcriptional activator/TolB-like protein